ncbi:MAG: endonuclease/exonuclease/phosphatase family protein [bacterium]|nr:endonuclease/exonuclease/phosphatase family protein [bacterium]
MTTRRRFLLNAAALALPLAASRRSFSDDLSPKRLCTITYNVLQCSGYPAGVAARRLGDRAYQMPKRFAMELALYEPDLITMQECPEEDMIAEIARRLKMSYAFFPSGEKWPGALMTRYQIVSSKNCPMAEGERPADLFTRHWGMARLRDGEGVEYTVHSVHLHPQSEGLRKREAAEVIRSMRADLDAGRNVILQGDFNHEPSESTYKLWMDAGLTDSFAKAGRGQGLTFNSTGPYKRIDYVWSNKPVSSRLREARVLYEGAFRPNADDPNSFALSDHIPVMAEFR